MALRLAGRQRTEPAPSSLGGGKLGGHRRAAGPGALGLHRVAADPCGQPGIRQQREGWGSGHCAARLHCTAQLHCAAWLHCAVWGEPGSPALGPGHEVQRARACPAWTGSCSSNDAVVLSTALHSQEAPRVPGEHRYTGMGCRGAGNPHRHHGVFHQWEGWGSGQCAAHPHCTGGTRVLGLECRGAATHACVQGCVSGVALC